jgi:hypothetical protein
MSCTRRRGITSPLSETLKPRPDLMTMTSGTIRLRSTFTKRRPGLGSSRPITAIAALDAASVKPHRCDRRFTSRLASSSIGCLHMAMAARVSSQSLQSSNCRPRHSARLRAPTPAGSMWCSSLSAMAKRCSSSSACSRSSPARPAAPGQAVFEIAVVVERLDQEMQRRAVFFGQAQAERLAVQVVLQRLVGARQVGGLGVALVVVVLARRRIAAPLAVVGRGLHRAVAFPAFLELGLALTSASFWPEAPVSSAPTAIEL